MAEWIIRAVEQGGYAGIVLLMFLENIFPPIPSEVIMPLAGYAASRGSLDVHLVVLAGTAGSLLGALPWYYAGRWLGCRRVERLAERYGRWMAIEPREVRAAERWFCRRGAWAVLFGRIVPGVRSLISLPAGMTAMPVIKLLALSLAGTAMWSGALVGAGYLLGAQYRSVGGWLGPITNASFVLLGALYLYRVVTWDKREPRDDRRDSEAGGREPGACD
jgi:membrane protein DedA with SNARE-associated domain